MADLIEPNPFDARFIQGALLTEVEKLRARITALESALQVANDNNAQYCKRHVAQLDHIEQLGKDIFLLTAENQRLRADLDCAIKIAVEKTALLVESSMQRKVRSDADR